MVGGVLLWKDSTHPTDSGLLQVANRTKSPSQFTDKTANAMVNLIKHEIGLHPIDSFLHSIVVK
jgi:hypothetical protein